MKLLEMHQRKCKKGVDYYSIIFIFYPVLLFNVRTLARNTGKIVVVDTLVPSLQSLSLNRVLIVSTYGTSSSNYPSVLWLLP